jgi:hypothetical protein
MARTPHLHAAALDRIGRERVLSHFNMTTQGYTNWKARGVPPMFVRSVATLAAIHGVMVPELYEGEPK